MIGSITRKQFISYAVLPGIIPRLNALVSSGFYYIPFFVALVYQTIGLLPRNHVYGMPENIGRFGIRHVIAEAANNLVLKRKNIDQICLFVVILTGLVLIFLQICLLLFALMFQPAMAQMPNNFAGYFVTPNPVNDLAFIFLDMVFGVPDPQGGSFFGSCVGLQGPCQDIQGANVIDDNTVPGRPGSWILQGLGWPFPVHQAMHILFQFYSIGLLVVATLLTTYFIFTVVAETAQSGTPFGRRFNKVWAPIRLVVAFGLLIPAGFGLNSSQYIVLYAAKFGSSFATNGWTYFTNVLTGTPMGPPQQGQPAVQNEAMVAKPKPPDLGSLLQFIYVSRICYELETAKTALWGPYLVDIRPYLVKDSAAVPNFLEVQWGGMGNPMDYTQLMTFADGDSNVILRFGHRNAVTDNRYLGGVEPICGEVHIPLVDPRMPVPAANPSQRGPEIMQRYYWYMIQEAWFGMDGSGFWGVNYPENVVAQNTNFLDVVGAMPEPTADNRKAILEIYNSDIDYAMTNPGLGGFPAAAGIGNLGALQEQRNSADWMMSNVMAEKGWAGAGIWYNTIADQNGLITAAVWAVPKVVRYPDVMEIVFRKKLMQDQHVPTQTRYKPVLADGRDIFPDSTTDLQEAKALWLGFDFWQQGDISGSTTTKSENNFLIDAIKSLFGTDGLYSMRENPDVHPLAQLTAVGRSLIDSAIRNMTLSAGMALTGLLASDPGVGAALSTGISMFMTIAMISLTAGFILFYIVPFLPFIYFYFAVGGWVKGIFEAMVGAPLWALAHIRIDGNGLPGSAATPGYFLIFEIFLRPILIIFGLLASVSIFAALVWIMNSTWDLVTANVSGFDITSEMTGPQAASLADYFRRPLDAFFFTVIYTIIVYLMGMSSFKLIDLIPNNILRWMGQSWTTFNDQNEDPAQSMVGTATIGAQQAIGKIGGGLQGVLSGAARG